MGFKMKVELSQVERIIYKKISSGDFIVITKKQYEGMLKAIDQYHHPKKNGSNHGKENR